MAGRSLQVSVEALEKVKRALGKRFGTQKALQEELGVSRQPIGNFFNGRTVARYIFIEICEQLNLDWQDIAELDQDEEPKTLEKEPKESSDIDDLVRKGRSHCCDKVQRNHSKIQLLNRKQIDVDHLYVDVYLLEDISSEVRARIDDLPQNFNFENER